MSDGAAKRRARSKTLAWRPDDEAALRRLRAQLAALHGVVLSERDTVALAIRHALDNPPAPARPAA